MLLNPNKQFLVKKNYLRLLKNIKTFLIYLFIYLDETNVSRCCISHINYIESLLLQGNNGKDQSVERPDPKDLSTFQYTEFPLSQGDLNSYPPNMELGTLSNWLASRVLVRVSRQVSLQERISQTKKTFGMESRRKGSQIINNNIA